MLRTQNKLRRSLVVFIATLLFSSAIVLALVKAAKKPSNGRLDSNQAARIRGPVQVVRFTLYDVGIEPQEVRAKPGLVTIDIEDLSGDSSGLVIERVEAASHVPAGLVGKATNRLRSRSELFLPKGRYEVADATRLDNRALLIVEP